MPLYLASYDIPIKNQGDYQGLWDYFKILKATKIQFSGYVVPFDGTALLLAENISEFLGPKDRLLVCELFDRKTTAWVTGIDLMISDKAFQDLLTRFARTLN